MRREYVAVYRKVHNGYVAFVEELPGAISLGATLDEARANLREAAMLVLAATPSMVAEGSRLADVIKEPLRVND